MTSNSRLKHLKHMRESWSVMVSLCHAILFLKINILTLLRWLMFNMRSNHNIFCVDPSRMFYASFEQYRWETKGFVRNDFIASGQRKIFFKNKMRIRWDNLFDHIWIQSMECILIPMRSQWGKKVSWNN